MSSMISSLTGTAFEVGPTFVIIRCGGVGYGVNVSPHVSAKIKTGYEAGLHIHTHVYEGGIDLYGFIEAEDREIFLLLTKVKGVGFKMALRVVSGLEREPLTQAIREGDTAALCKIPGVGKRTAERLVVELRTKLGGERISRGNSEAPEPTPPEQARSALVNMGYKLKDVKRIMPSMSGEGSVSEQIVEGLRLLQGS